MQIVTNRTLSYYWSSQPGQGCDSYQADALGSLRPLGLEPFLEFPSQTQDIVLISGTHRYQQPVLDVLTNQTGAHCRFIRLWGCCCEQNNGISGHEVQENFFSQYARMVPVQKAI